MNTFLRRLLPFFLLLSATPAATPPAPAAEVERLCGDLLGHTMGGRERCWKFQARAQIKELLVKRASEDAQQRVYEVALKLQAAPGAPLYAAEARLEYRRQGAAWNLAEVGLLKLARLEPARPPSKQ